MVLSQLLLRKRVGQAFVLLGLTTTIMCLWIAQHEWEYHSSDTHSLRRHLNGDKVREYVFVNALLDEIHGDADIKQDSNDYNDMLQQKISDKSSEPSFQEPCPLYPSDVLVGRLAGIKECVAPEELALMYPDVEVGGRVRPKNCTAAEKVAIIIPFRKRFTHLYILMNNLIPLLQRQLIDARFFIIEQAMPTTFNRASLFNIGFLEALKFDNYDCFIFHDVDLIPLNDKNLYRCDDHPIHFAVAMDKYNYQLPYKTYFGGVVGFTKEQYLKINGNSNLYFGWGGEDDDLYERIINKKYEIARPYNDVGKYDMIRHIQDSGNEDNCDRRRLLKSATERQDIEGLNTVKYQKMYINVKSHMTWINVFLDMNEILATAPDSLRQEMEMKHSDARSNLCNFSRGASIHE
uniref:Beta-1,4-galactosyltransferase n=1 Tax=Arion vulgaris TaxID=1028688 RepID=A0A0B7B0I7_9EUPU